MHPTQLEVLVHGRRVLTVDVDRSRVHEDGSPAGWKFLTTAWDEASNDPHEWLSALLPENGDVTWYVIEATARLREHGIHPTSAEGLPALWASPDAEYPGAVSFRSMYCDPTPPEYQPVSDNQIKHRINAAALASVRPWRGRPRHYPMRRVSLAGMRPKFGLAWLDGRWHTAHGSALTSWIVKSEWREGLPGEAGVESICQRALPLLGVRAARTRAATFKKLQVVLSERSDRTTDPTTGITPVHQEDFAQAAGWPCWDKYDEQSTHEPRWETAYELLRRYAAAPQAEQDALTRLVAAAWGLGHCDLHRRNFGFLHEPSSHASPRIRLAPAYDVSSSVGTHYAHLLAIGVAGKEALEQIGEDDWVEHARRCGCDPGHTLSLVRDTVRQIPQAVAAARDAAREHDDNLDQDSVDRRAEAIMRHAEERSRALGQSRGPGR